MIMYQRILLIIFSRRILSSIPQTLLNKWALSDVEIVDLFLSMPLSSDVLFAVGSAEKLWYMQTRLRLVSAEESCSDAFHAEGQRSYWMRSTERKLESTTHA
jgi:hypothetical protein